MTTTATSNHAPQRVSYGGLLAIAEFRWLFVAQVISVLGNVVAQVTLAVLIYDRSGSPLLSSLTFTLGMVPYLVGGTAVAAVIDRLPARRTMVACDLFSAAVIALMVTRLPVWTLLILVFAEGLASAVFAGVRAAILPQLLPDGAPFVFGRAMFGMVWQGAQVIGYASGALLLSCIGTRGSLAVDAVSFLSSALLIRFGTRCRRPELTCTQARPWHALTSLRTDLTNRWLRSLLLVRWLLPACALAPEALAAAYVHMLHRSTSQTGLLLGVVAGGMLATNLLAGRLLTPEWQRRLMIPAAVVQVGSVTAMLAPVGFGISIALLAVNGMGSCWGLGRDSLLFEEIPEASRARILVLDSTGLMVVQGIGFTIWGATAQVLPVRSTLAVAGAAGGYALFIFGLRWRQQRTTISTGH